MPLGAARLNTLSKVLTTTSAATGLKWLDTNDSYYLNGTVSSNSSSSVDLTVSFWFRHVSGMASDAAPILMYAADNSISNFTGIEYQGGRVRVVTQHAGSLNDFLIGTYSASYGSGTYDDGEWHHFLFSRDGSASAKHAYVDGNSVSINVNAGRDNGSANMWNGSDMTKISIMSGHGFTGETRIADVHIAQFFVDNTFIDITQTSNREKFYKFGGAVDMGADGTSSGLDQPLIFHQGDTTTFDTKGGDTTTFPYSMTQNGTGIDGDPDDGPPINSRQPAIWSNGGFSVTGSGVFNNALQLSGGGSNGSVQLPAGKEFDDNVERTLEFRFKLSHGGVSGKTTKVFSTISISTDNFPTSSNHLTLHTYSNGNLYFTHDGSEANLGNPGTGFHHIAMQYDGTGSFHLWLDGTHKVSATHSISQASDLYFGNRTAGEGNNSGTTNTIDEIRVSSTTRYPHNTNNITVPTSAFTSDSDTIALFHCESTTQTDDQS